MLPNGALRASWIRPNPEVAAWLRKVALGEHIHEWTLVVEMMGCYGQTVGITTFDTLIWLGRFIESWGGRFAKIERREVKKYLCNSMSAKDKNVRQAMIDRYGGDEVALAGKKCPRCKGKGWFGAGRKECGECHGACWERVDGPLANISADQWAALAVAHGYYERGKIITEAAQPQQLLQTPAGAPST